MSILVVVLIVILLMAVFSAPQWPYARSWGYGWYPPGLLGMIVVVLLVLFLLGVIPGARL